MDNLICLIQIGGTNANNATRTVGRFGPNDGWQGIIDRDAWPAFKWGFKRILLHNPFGTLGMLPGGTFQNMQFDQYIHARDGIPGVHPPLPWLTNGFIEAWKGINFNQVIDYLGTFVGDSDFTPQNYLTRVAESIALPLLAGHEIGFDMATYHPKDLAFKALRRIDSHLGTKCLVEGYPNADLADLMDHPMTLLDKGYRQAVASGEINKIKGEVIRWVNEPPAGQSWSTVAQWFPSLLKETTDRGHTVLRELATYTAAGFNERADTGL